MDHDAVFKMLLKTPTVLQAFFEAFLPEVARFVDFGALEFVDKELFTRGRKKRTGDLLVRTRFRGQRAGFLIHLEHQAQRDPSLPRRMSEPGQSGTSALLRVPCNLQDSKGSKVL